MSIAYIDIVHHYHADIGYTDHPLRARQRHAQFVGKAVDFVLNSAQEKDPFAAGSRARETACAAITHS